MSEQKAINPFPLHRRGLHAVRSEPYIYKDRWLEAPFGARWRELKARLRGEYGDGGSVMRWESKMITVATWTQRGSSIDRTVTQEVQALVSGAFAVHETVHWMWGGWTVTHVPTGRSIASCLRSKPAAKRCVERIAPLADWQSMAADDARTLPDDAKRAVYAAIQEAS